MEQGDTGTDEAKRVTVPPLDLSYMDEMARPASALARGVQITENQAHVNPQPIVQEESDMLLESFLSPRKLKSLTGEEDLNDVKFLELKVDTRETSLGNFGVHIPNLEQLKLSHSVIPTLRDLGSTLRNIQVLWLNQCGMENIDGISNLSSLQEVFLAYNDVSDISPCSMLEHIRVIDLEGNNIKDIMQVEFLAMCHTIVRLTLEGNPVCVTPYPEYDETGYDYRKAVRKAVPHLMYLDDEPLDDTTSEVEQTKEEPSFHKDWNMLHELMRDGTVVSSDDSVDVSTTPGRPGTAQVRLAEGYRPGSALKPSSAQKRPNTGLIRPSTGSLSAGSPSGSRPSTGRPATARPGSAVSDDSDVGSALTYGTVVCGNPSKALRMRRSVRSPPDSEPPQSLVVQVRQRLDFAETPHRDVTDVPDDSPEEKSELYAELDAFRQDHQRWKVENEASKAPQILRIDHDADDLSDDEDDVSSEEDPAAVPEDDPGQDHTVIPLQDDSGARPLTNQSVDSGVQDLSARSLPTPASREGPVDLNTLKYKRLGPISSHMGDGSVRRNRRIVAHDESFDADGDVTQQTRLVPTPPSPGHTPMRVPVPPPDAQSRGAVGVPMTQLAPSGVRSKKLANFQLLPSKFGK